MNLVNISEPSIDCSIFIRDIWKSQESIYQIVNRVIYALLHEDSVQQKADICCICASRLLCETSFDECALSVIEDRIKMGGAMPFLVALAILESMQFVPFNHINKCLFRDFVISVRNSSHFINLSVVDAMAKKLNI